MKLLNTEGFELIPHVFNHKELAALQTEADRLALTEGSVCVRHLRQKSKDFHHLATSKRLQQLLPQGLSPVRSILFDKTPTQNWPVPWHQDLTITVKEKVELKEYGPWSIKDGSVHVQPPEGLLKKMVTLRIHLDDTPETNGALKVIPKSSLKGKIPSNEISHHLSEPEIICSCQAGDVLLMSPLILHASQRSQIPSRRRILHFEYAPISKLDKNLSWYEQPPPEY